MWFDARGRRLPGAVFHYREDFNTAGSSKSFVIMASAGNASCREDFWAVSGSQTLRVTGAGAPTRDCEHATPRQSPQLGQE